MESRLEGDPKSVLHSSQSEEHHSETTQENPEFRALTKNDDKVGKDIQSIYIQQNIDCIHPSSELSMNKLSPTACSGKLSTPTCGGSKVIVKDEILTSDDMDVQRSMPELPIPSTQTADVAIKPESQIKSASTNSQNSAEGQEDPKLDNEFSTSSGDNSGTLPILTITSAIDTHNAIDPHTIQNLSIEDCINPDTKDQKAQQSVTGLLMSADNNSPILPLSKFIEMPSIDSHNAIVTQRIKDSAKEVPSIQDTNVHETSTFNNDLSTSDLDDSRTAPLSNLKEIPSLDSHNAIVPQKIQFGFRSVHVEITSIDSKEQFILYGTNAGCGFLYNRGTGELLKLVCEARQDVVKTVQLFIGIECQCAFGTSDGKIILTIMSFGSAPNTRRVQKFALGKVHSSEVACMEWSTNGMKLFSGDKNGNVHVVERDFAKNQCHVSPVLKEEKAIVDLSYKHRVLLVSTTERTIIYNMNNDQKVVIGSKARQGIYGACFGVNSISAADLQIYCARPGYRIWIADINGKVTKTLLLKDLVLSEHSEIEIVDPPGKVVTKDNQFRKLMFFQKNYLLVHSDSSLFMIDPSVPRVLASCQKFDGVENVTLTKNEIFVLCKNREIRRISEERDELAYKRKLLEEENESETMKKWKGMKNSLSSNFSLQALQSKMSSINEEAGQWSQKLQSQAKVLHQKLPTIGSSLFSRDGKTTNQSETSETIAMETSSTIISPDLDPQLLSESTKEDLPSGQSVDALPDGDDCQQTAKPTSVKLHFEKIEEIGHSDSHEIVFQSRRKRSKNRSPSFRQSSTSDEHKKSPSKNVTIDPNVSCPVSPTISETSTEDLLKVHGAHDADENQHNASGQVNDSVNSVNDSDGSSTASAVQSNLPELFTLKCEDHHAPPPNSDKSSISTEQMSHIPLGGRPQIFGEELSKSPAADSESDSQYLKLSLEGLHITQSDAIFNSLNKHSSPQSFENISDSTESLTGDELQEEMSRDARPARSPDISQKLNKPENNPPPQSMSSPDKFQEQSGPQNSGGVHFDFNPHLDKYVKHIDPQTSKEEHSELIPDLENSQEQIVPQNREGAHLELIPSLDKSRKQLGSQNNGGTHRELMPELEKSREQVEPQNNEVNRSPSIPAKVFPEKKLPVRFESAFSRKSTYPDDDCLSSSPDDIYAVDTATKDFESELESDEEDDKNPAYLQRSTISTTLSVSRNHFRDTTSVPVKLIDSWSSAPLPQNVSSISASDNFVWFIDHSNQIYLTEEFAGTPSSSIKWRKFDKTGIKLCISPSGDIMWLLGKNGAVHVAVMPTDLGLMEEPLKFFWEKVTANISCITLGHGTAWAVTNDGVIKSQLDLSRSRPFTKTWNLISWTRDNGKVSDIAVTKSTVWCRTDQGCLWRTGIENAHEERAAWVKVLGFGDCAATILSMTSDSRDTIFVVDAKGVISFLTDNGKLWQVNVSEYIDEDRQFIPNSFVQFLPENVATSVHKVQRWIRRPIQGQLLAVNSQSIWIIHDRYIATVARGPITGQRWDTLTPLGVSKSSKWRNITTSSVFSPHLGTWVALVWASRPNGEIFCFSSQDVAKNHPVALPPAVLSDTPIVCMSACKDALWVLYQNGDIYIRSGITTSCLQGNEWSHLDTKEQLGDVKITHISCGTQHVWAVDSEGQVFFRIGVTAVDRNSLPPAWIPIDGCSVGGRHFTQIECGLSDSSIWAIDNYSEVYVRTGVSVDLPIGIQWEAVPGSHARQLCISNHTVWGLRISGNLIQRFGISQQNQMGNYWKKIRGRLMKIAATPYDELWAIDEAEHLCHLSTTVYCPLVVEAQYQYDEMDDVIDDDFSFPENVERDWEIL